MMSEHSPDKNEDSEDDEFDEAALERLPQKTQQQLEKTVHPRTSVMIRPPRQQSQSVEGTTQAKNGSSRMSMISIGGALRPGDTRQSMLALREGGIGILVHGCHLQADEWEKIVWGEPPERLGRLPHTALLAWQERQTLKHISVGTGASSNDRGELEGEVTLRVLLDRIPRLAEFDAFQGVPLDRLEPLLRRTARAELVSQNTVEEVREGLRRFADKGCTRAVLVSSPTHLPRCLSCACVVDESDPELFTGSVWASPCDTSYHHFHASDVVVVEPPHRGDRDKSLDDLPFHSMVKRSFKIQGDQRKEFLKQFDNLLTEFSV